MVDKKQNLGLLVVCIGIWMLLYYRFKIKKVQMLDLINEKLFDLKLITAEDYTIKISIKNSMVKKFKE